MRCSSSIKIIRACIDLSRWVKNWTLPFEADPKGDDRESGHRPKMITHIWTAPFLWLFRRIFALFSNVMLKIVQPLGWRVWVMCCRRIFRCHLEYNIHCFGDKRPPGKKCHLEFIVDKMPPGKNSNRNTTLLVDTLPHGTPHSLLMNWNTAWKTIPPILENHIQQRVVICLFLYQSASWQLIFLYEHLTGR